MGLHCRNCIHLRFGRYTRWRGVRGRGEDRDEHERSRVAVCSPCDMRVSHRRPHSVPTGHSEGKRARPMSPPLQLRASSGDGSSPPPPTPVTRRTMDIFLYDKMNTCKDVGREFPLFISLSLPPYQSSSTICRRQGGIMHAYERRCATGSSESQPSSCPLFIHLAQYARPCKSRLESLRMPSASSAQSASTHRSTEARTPS